MTATYDPDLIAWLVTESRDVISKLERGLGVNAVTSNFMPVMRAMAEQLEVARTLIDRMRDDAEVGFARMHAIDRENLEQRQADDRKLVEDYEAKLDALRVEVEHLREARRLAMDGGERIKAERDALRTEVEDMRPVVEAAERWVSYGPVCAGIKAAVEAYRKARKP